MHPYPTTPRPQFAIRHHVLPQFPTATSACSPGRETLSSEISNRQRFRPSFAYGCPPGGRRRRTGRAGRTVLIKEASPPEEVEQSLAASRGGRKVRTPQGMVAANGGPERSGESATERRQPRAFGHGATVKRGGKSSPGPFERADAR